MAKKFIVLGDSTTHGGKVITAWGQDGPTPMTINGIPVACLGDKVSCPKKGHDGACIIEGASDPDAMLHGRQIAREGDKTSCGAALVSTQTLATHG